jgi:hypothetical protein
MNNIRNNQNTQLISFWHKIKDNNYFLFTTIVLGYYLIFTIYWSSLSSRIPVWFQLFDTTGSPKELKGYYLSLLLWPVYLIIKLFYVVISIYIGFVFYNKKPLVGN